MTSRQLQGNVVTVTFVGEVERAFDLLVPQWIESDWPFQRPSYLGRDIAWRDWLALPRAS